MNEQKHNIIHYVHILLVKLVKAIIIIIIIIMIIIIVIIIITSILLPARLHDSRTVISLSIWMGQASSPAPSEPSSKDQ